MLNLNYKKLMQMRLVATPGTANATMITLGGTAAPGAITNAGPFVAANFWPSVGTGVEGLSAAGSSIIIGTISSAPTETTYTMDSYVLSGELSGITYSATTDAVYPNGAWVRNVSFFYNGEAEKTVNAIGLVASSNASRFNCQYLLDVDYIRNEKGVPVPVTLVPGQAYSFTYSAKLT